MKFFRRVSAFSDSCRKTRFQHTLVSLASNSSSSRMAFALSSLSLTSVRGPRPRPVPPLALFARPLLPRRPRSPQFRARGPFKRRRRRGGIDSPRSGVSSAHTSLVLVFTRRSRLVPPGAACRGFSIPRPAAFRRGGPLGWGPFPCVRTTTSPYDTQPPPIHGGALAPVSRSLRRDSLTLELALAPAAHDCDELE
jgi:hypothetical protein